MYRTGEEEGVREVVGSFEQGTEEFIWSAGEHDHNPSEGLGCDGNNRNECQLINNS